MIDIKDLRENPEKYRRGAELKNVSVNIAAVLDLDGQCLRAQQDFDRLRAEQNELSRQIGKAKDPQERESIKAKAGAMKPQLQELEQKRKTAEAARDQLLLQIPQPPDDDVPVGKDAADNVVLYAHGEPRHFEFKPKSHIELGKSLDILDFEAGVTLAGSRSYFLKGAGADLHQAVLRLALEMMTREKGFTQLTVPVLVRDVAMQGTGFFPASREQAYHVSEDDLFLTGTAEVGLTAYHLDQMLDESALPAEIRRLEHLLPPRGGHLRQGHRRALSRPPVRQGRAGRHLQKRRRGIQALAQGNAQLRRGGPEAAEAAIPRDSVLHRRHRREKRLDDGHRNLDAQPLRRQEPGQRIWRNAFRLALYEFQARRLNLRYKTADGKIRFVHTLNNTVVASPRILIPILENYQNADGSVTIPEALRPLMGGRDRIG